MKIDDIIKELQKINKKYGNLPCLIEVEMDYVTTDVEIDDCCVEKREGYGLSVKFMM